MASYRGHLAFSSILGSVYGGAAMLSYDLDWGPAVLGAGLTTLGGLLPDLDSDSGVPVRELFALAAAVVPLFFLRRLSAQGFTYEQSLVLMACVYLLIRYGLKALFKRITVHRGMFHSVPAMLIAGVVVHLVYNTGNQAHRVFLAAGVMLGFLSHLVLDELCSVDFMGLQIKLNKYAGSALKFFSPSWTASLFTYALLAVLVYAAGQGRYFPEADWQTIGTTVAKCFKPLPTGGTPETVAAKQPIREVIVTGAPAPLVSKRVYRGDPLTGN